MIYRLTNDMKQVEDFGDFEAVQIRYEGDAHTRFQNPEIDYKDYVPAQIEFIGDFERLKQTDYPHTNTSLPLFTPKLLLAALDAGNFTYGIYPTRIYNRDFVSEEMPEAERLQITDSKLLMDQFVIVHLLSWTNVIDLQQTVVAELDRKTKKWKEVTVAQSSDPEWVRPDDVKELHLTVQEDTLPGLIRFENMPGLFATQKTKASFERTGIRGVSLWPIPRD